MAVDDSRLRELSKQHRFTYVWEMDTRGVCYICHISIFHLGKIVMTVQTPPTPGDQAAFDQTLEHFISQNQSRWADQEQQRRFWAGELRQK